MQENPLSSADSLAAKKVATQGTDTPVIKSLFDIPGNSKYKAPETKPAKKSFGFDNPFRRSDEGSRGMTITVAKPETFKPKEVAANPF